MRSIASFLSMLLLAIPSAMQAANNNTPPGKLSSLYAYNAYPNDQLVHSGNAVPFNHISVLNGTDIAQTDATTFTLNAGTYLVSFNGYTSVSNNYNIIEFQLNGDLTPSGITEFKYNAGIVGKEEIITVTNPHSTFQVVVKPPFNLILTSSTNASISIVELDSP